MPKNKQQYQQDSDQDYMNRKPIPAPVKLEKNGLDKVDLRNIVVNLSKTHYDILWTVVEELGWVVTESKKNQAWDIMWTDHHVELQELFRLSIQQKISHFPGIYVLANKNFLGRSLMKMNRVFPAIYDYFPHTWSLPSELGEFIRFHSQFGQHRQDEVRSFHRQHIQDEQGQQKQPIYIFKPEAGCQGKGISLFTKIEEIEQRTGIVQIYVNNPLLIDGLKFDLRIYVLIYGCDPMRIYLYEEGLARFATELYERAKKRNLKDNYVHLTNYAINKNNKKFVFNTSEHSMHVGHKRSLSSIYGFLQARGVNIALIKQKIQQLIVRTLLVGKPMLEHTYGLCQKDDLTKDHCFQILGFDVMLDDQLEPVLLQVNHTPSFATDTPLDKNIKKGLLKETLLLLNVNKETKKQKVERRVEQEQKRAQRKLVKMTAQQRQVQRKEWEAEKNNYQAHTLQKYKRIYPVDSKQYDQIEQYAAKLFQEHSGIKNRQVNRSKQTHLKASLRPASLQQIPSNKKHIKDSGFGIQQDANSNKKHINNVLGLQQEGGPYTKSTHSNLIGPADNRSKSFLQKLPDISPKKTTSILSPQRPPCINSRSFSKDQCAQAKLCSSPRINRLRHQPLPVSRLSYKEDFADRSQIFEGSFLKPRLIQISSVYHDKTSVYHDKTSVYHDKTRQLDSQIVNQGRYSQSVGHNKHTAFTDLSAQDKNLLASDKNLIVVVRKPMKKASQEPARKAISTSLNRSQQLPARKGISKSLHISQQLATDMLLTKALGVPHRR